MLGAVQAFAGSIVESFPATDSGYLWTAGNTVTSNVFTDVPSSTITGLTENWTYVDALALNVQATWNIEVNGTTIGSETLMGCDGCGINQPSYTLSNSFSFADVAAVSGGYQISLVLQNTMALGDGSIDWPADGTTTLSYADSEAPSETPEPNSLLLLASGLVALGGMARRKFAR